MTPGLQLPPGATLETGEMRLPAGAILESNMPEQSFAEGLREFARKMNLVSMAQGFNQNLAHPVEALKRWGAVNDKLVTEASEAYKRGDYTEAAAHALHYVLNGIPGLGEALDEAGTKLRNGDIAGGLADTAALGTQVAVGIKTPAIANAVGRAVEAAPRIPSAVAAAAKAGGADVATGAAKLGAAGLIGEHLPGELGTVARFGLGYPGIKQAGRGLVKGAAAFRSAMAEPEAAAPAVAATVAPAVETLADGSTVQDIARGQGIKSWKNATADQKAGAQGIFDKLKAAEAAAPTSAAGVPPPSPTPSAPRAQPASAAPTVLQPNGGPLRPPLAPQPATAAPSIVSAARPETTPNVVQMPKAANTAPEAIPTFTGQRLVPYQDLWKTPLRQAAGEPQPLIEVKDQVWHPEEFAKGKAYQYLHNEHFFAVRDALEAGKPVPPEVLADYPQLQKQAAAVSPETQDIDFQQRYGETEQPEVAKFLGHDQPAPASKAPSAASIAQARNAQAKGERFADALIKYRENSTEDWVQSNDFLENWASDPVKSKLTQKLIKAGLLKNTEKFSDTSWPYMIQKLRQTEGAGKAQ